MIRDLFYWVFRYHIEYIWGSVKYLWTRKNPGNYLVGLFLVVIGIIAYHTVLSSIYGLLYVRRSISNELS